MGDDEPNKSTAAIGGDGKVVEVDETLSAAKRRTAPIKTPRRRKPFRTLVERGGRVRSFYVANITIQKLRPFVTKNLSLKSTLNRRGDILCPDGPRIRERIMR